MMGVRRWAFLGVVGLLAFGGCGLSPRARADTATRSVVLHVDGMTCASCTVTVRVALTKLPGVKSATVSVKDQRAVVAYDPAKVTPEQMIEAVTKAGYRARVATGS